MVRIERRGCLSVPRVCSLIGATFVALLISGLLAKGVSAQPAREHRPLGPGQLVALDFDNAEIRAVIKQISELIGRNFLVDEKVRGKVTIITPRKIRIRDVYRVFLTLLHTYGFTAVRSGEVTKIIPLADASRTGIATILPGDADKLPPSDRIVTSFIQLNHADSGVLVGLLRPLAAREGSLIAYQPSNAIIMTDTAANVRRITSIIRSVDIPSTSSNVVVIHLKYAVAKDMTQTLRQMVETGPVTVARTRPTRPGVPRARAGQAAIAGGRGQIKILPDDRTNSIILVAPPVEVFRLRSLVKKLDIPPPAERKRIHVYRLKNALAEELANVLNQQVLAVNQGAARRPSASGQQPARRSTAAVPVSQTSGVKLLEDVAITPDKATNSLIVRASPEDYLALTEIIRKLDVRRSQVLVEALIAEMTLEKASELGVEWRLLNQPNRSGTSVIGGTNFPLGGAAQGVINQFASSSFAGPTGLILGAARGVITFGDQVFADIRGLIRAFQGDSDINILSTPQILTTDNEEAEIIVGENRPFVTQSQTSAEGRSTIQTFEFRDVGVTLRITPHISPNRFVRMKIFQEILNFVSEPEVGAVITTKRSASTSVTVEDGQTVVIGGLIRDDTVKSVSKVPLLGDIPILGMFFRAERESKIKTNLLIFITPRVITTPEEHMRLTDMKRENAGQFINPKKKSIKERL